MPEPTPPLSTVGTTRGLRAALLQVDRDGWDSPAGAAVLTYARERIVRPTVRRTGLRGPCAEQAEATGWEAAWETLRSLGDGMRTPWGVVTLAVRRAVRGELLAAAYCTSPRTAWQLRADFRGAVPLEQLRGGRWEPSVATVTEASGATLGAVTDAMVSVGWSRDDVEAVVDWVVARVGRTGAGPGWRVLATRSGLPPWRVRRAMALLLGDAGWPGLVERAARDGAGVLDRPEARAAVRSTVLSSHPRPASAARRVLQAERTAS